MSQGFTHGLVLLYDLGLMESLLNTSPSRIDPRYALFASAWAIGTVGVLIVIKGYAYAVSESAAVLASLTDSCTDALISIMMLFALRYALRPADSSHRHGHGKMEGIAALFQAAFLAGAGLFLFFESVHRLANPQPVMAHGIAMGITMVAIFLSVILVMVQNYCLRRAPSLAIESDRAHYNTDVALNLVVLLALMIGYFDGPYIFDPLAAIMVAAFYGWTARKIALKAMDMLMDRELPDAVRDRIKAIIGRHTDILGVHDLRTRKSGMVIHISFDVEIAPDLTLKAAHEIVRALEIDILTDYPHAEIIIHKDPHGDIHDSRHKETRRP
jgi:ferrous-iron efflux pump FieF